MSMSYDDESHIIIRNPVSPMSQKYYTVKYILYENISTSWGQCNMQHIQSIQDTHSTHIL